MYERMLDKLKEPSLNEMIKYCGITGELFECLNQEILFKYKTEFKIRFPYGNHYGWGIKHKFKNEHICDIFPEKDAFTIMIRLTNKQIDKIYWELSAYTQEICDNKYPCGEGGWLKYRVVSNEYMEDAFKLLNTKLQK
ncbi:DUF3788 domain-containing protein [Tissierella carlieri]|uniref:DUF3788 domain-containing protein n=1 Tax=Tissierella carlieri TaxID=689904 RepID=UPI001C0FD091|nr:DUF3788 domain-containing protein [Tissierella carlieri]MBU5311961.1 DUF3788 domain-containing protein [Tissierella carlieri]